MMSGIKEARNKRKGIPGGGARCLDKAGEMSLSQDSEEASLTEAEIEMKS